MASTETLHGAVTDMDAEQNRQSDALRASVLDAALQLGLGSNGIDRWLDGEVDTETISSPTLTYDRSATSASEESWSLGSRQTSPTIDRTGKDYQSSYPNPILVEDYRLHGEPRKITIVDPETLPRYDRSTKKLKKKRADGYESDSGYVSDPGSKKKKKDKASAALEEQEKKRLKEEKREAKVRAREEKKEAKKAKEETGYETDVKASRFKRSKSKKVDKARDGYETDDGYQSSGSAIKKRPKFLRLGGKPKQDLKEPPASPPAASNFTLPIAERFATTVAGGSRSGTPTITAASSSLDLSSTADTASIATMRPSANSSSSSPTASSFSVSSNGGLVSASSLDLPRQAFSPAPSPLARPPIPPTLQSQPSSPAPPILRIAVSNTATPISPPVAISRSASPITPTAGTPWTPSPVSPLRSVRKRAPSPLNFPVSPVSPLSLSRSNSPAPGQASTTKVPSRAPSPFLHPEAESPVQVIVTNAQPTPCFSPRRTSFCDIPPPTPPPSSPLPKPPMLQQGGDGDEVLSGRRSPMLAAGAAIQRGKMAPFPTKPLSRRPSANAGPSSQRNGHLQTAGVRFQSPPGSAQPATSAYSTAQLGRRPSGRSGRRRSDSDVALIPGINIEEPSDGEDAYDIDDVPDIDHILSRYAYDGTEDDIYKDDSPHRPAAVRRRGSAELIGKLPASELESWSRKPPTTNRVAFNPTESIYSVDTASVYPDDARSTMYDLDQDVSRQSVVDNSRSERMRKVLLGRVDAEYDQSGREREVVSPSPWASPRRSPTNTSDPPKAGWF